MADGRLIFDTKLNKEGFKKGLSGLGDLAKTGFSVVTKAVAAAATALTAFAAYSIKVGSDFDAGMSEVAAISGATGDDLQALRDKAKEMGATTKFSATESAEALKYMAMAGWQTEQMLDGLPGVMYLAAASGEALGTVSDIVTDSMTAFGMEASQAGHFADVLAKTATSTNTNVGMLGESFKYVASTAGSLGYSVEDVSQVLGIMANAGIKGSMAGTALRSALSSLSNPTEQTAIAMEELGISMFDAEGNAKPLNEVIGDLRGTMADMTQEQKSTYLGMLFGERAINGMLPVINASAEEWDNLAESLANTEGAAEDMANVMIDNLQGDITILKSAVEGLGISIFEMGDGPMRGAVQMANEFVDELNALITTADVVEDKIHVTADGMILMDEAAGQSTNKFQKFGEVVGDMLSRVATEAANLLPQLVELGVGIIENLLAGIQKNLPQIGQAAGQILSTLLSATVRLYPRLLGMGVELITQIAQGLAGNAHSLTTELLTAVTSLIDTITENIPLFLAAGLEILTGLITGIQENLPGLIESGIEMLQALVTGLSETIPELIPIVLEILVFLADTIIENLPLIVDMGIQLIMALAQGIIENLPYLIEQVPRIINSFADTVYEQFPKILKLAFDLIVTLGKGLIDSIPTLIANIPEIIMAIINAFTLSNFFNLGKSVLTSVKNGISNIVPNLKGAASNAAQGVQNIIKSGWANAKAWGSTMVNSLKGGISAVSQNLINTGKLMAEAAIKSIKTAFSGAAQIGRDLVVGLWNGIGSVKDWILSKISGFVGSIMSGIKNFFGIKSPSKRMADEIGKMLPPGISIGFEAEMPDLKKNIDRELDDLTGQMQMAVNSESNKIGANIAVESRTQVDHRREQMEAERGGMIHTEINMDGKPVGDSVTPYVSNNIARKRARRMSHAY